MTRRAKRWCAALVALLGATAMAQAPAPAKLVPAQSEIRFQIKQSGVPLGFAASRAQARQLVRHGHFLVNGKKVDIPSFQVKEGDVITVLGRTQKNPTIEHAMEEVKGRGIPEWLSFDQNTITGRVNAMPTREQINLPVQEQLIVELYSK